MTPALTVLGLHKRYGSLDVLRDFSLTLESGDVLALMGPNGSGKSTLLGCVTGTVIPDAGSVSIAGFDLGREGIDARRQLRYLAQELDAPAGLTGAEILRFFADVFEDQTSLPRAKAMADLGPALEHLASTYSVGMRRRLLFAGLVLGSAALYVLDEPFSGLDGASRERMVGFIAARAKAGAAVLIAAHAHDIADLEQTGARRLQLAPTTPQQPRA